MREAELRKALLGEAAELGAIVVKAGGESLTDEELFEIIKSSVRLGGSAALKKLA